MNRIYNATVTALLVLGIVASVAAWTGCSGSTRQKTLHATLIAVDSARDGFVAYDRARQERIVDTAESQQAALDRLAAYRRDRESIVEAFAQAYKLLATAALLEQDKSLAAALTAARQLAELLATFGCDACGKVSK